MISKEFFKALDLLAEERDISKELILDSFSKGLVAAFRKNRGHSSCRIEINPEKSEILIFEQRLVVSDDGFDLEADPKYKQIKLLEARKIKKRIKVGDILEESINPKEFSQAAVQNLKNVLNQNLKAIEKEQLYAYFKEKEKEMLNAKIIGEDDNYFRLDISRGVTTLLPKKECTSLDDFVVGETIKIFISLVEMKSKGPKVLVTRLDKSLVTRLFEDYIPEIKEGIVEIMGLARDPGDRTKIGVKSNDPNVDAIGSCVGAGGNRIREIVQALSGEKIDLFLWSDNEKDLIANSLQPAEVVDVIQIDPIYKTALAIVSDDKLSLAIGKEGQNVKLAVQTINWKIDIKSISMAEAENLL
ncbi:MAG: transcription termination factor NusA [Acholeplasmatales bacterium]|jgi:N utilization substance protein A|nr:transcription termination factor NusA [Acholeplasmataceae bacterium]MCK9289122.1 transcription termination factor NusA [Acholeplasmataceae bacterium]MCK9427114.1 transcription termination factor NusA [Acholeplasmataceae bacterium]MDY0114946.1 transcription termination factor NusA [Acholeplasmatales bacterium]HHT39800.1 transcription termination/antitermination protein NusA [Acholeplasmataceae bacterium]